MGDNDSGTGTSTGGGGSKGGFPKVEPLPGQTQSGDCPAADSKETKAK